MKKSIEAIGNLLAEDQKELLKSIYAPKVVGVPLSDSRRSICVLPTGEIRSYGKIGADICKREEGRHAYLSSFDGGMSWQTRYATGKMRSATYFEDFDLYILGENLVIDFFSPSRLILSGKIKTISYLSDSKMLSEEL